MKKLIVTLYGNRVVRRDVYDIVKVIVGVVAAKYGLKLA